MAPSAVVYTIKHDFRKVERLLADLPRSVRAGLPQGINRTITQARNAGQRAITKRYTLAPAVIKTRMVVSEKASLASLVAEISVRGRTPGLQRFRATQVRKAHGQAHKLFVTRKGHAAGRKLKRGRSGDVKVEVIKGRKRTLKNPRTFMATMPGGGVGVFKREEGVGRLPITRLAGPSVQGMYRIIGRSKIGRYVRGNMRRIVHSSITHRLSQWEARARGKR